MVEIIHAQSTHPLGLRRTKITVYRVNIGQQKQRIGIYLLCKQCAGRILVDDCLHANKAAIASTYHGNATAPRADDNHIIAQQDFQHRQVGNFKGRRRRDHAAPLVTILRDRPVGSRRPALGLGFVLAGVAGVVVG